MCLSTSFKQLVVRSVGMGNSKIVIIILRMRAYILMGISVDITCEFVKDH